MAERRPTAAADATDAAEPSSDWKALGDAERDREYSPSSCIGGDYRPFIEAYRSGSVRAHEEAIRLGGRWQTLRYGPGDAQTVELCLPSVAAASALAPATPAPAGLLVFIHGGYWQELSARDSLFAAADCLRAGLAFAAVDYTLAPAARVEDIVDECRRALATLISEAPALGLDRGRIVVAGSSAGAHLAAMSALGTLALGPPAPQADRRASARTAGPAIRALVLLSGIYDLEPLIGTSINPALGLDAARARALSPQRADLRGTPPALIAWGAIETAEFKRQSLDFAAALHRSGTRCEAFEVAGRNHFDLVFDLLDGATRLGRETLAACGSATGRLPD